ncbi:MAG: hypothetical protein DCC67_15305 [Planctomycetota bacterium]|nr:MAG: hypothetical protein DCC67_15305 [Planctomycetota bacterium]
MKRKPQPLKRHRVRPSLEALEARLCLSVYYDFHVVAQTGSQFSSLGAGPSINSAGQVAFQGSWHNSTLGATVDNVFVYHPALAGPVNLMRQQYEQPNSGPAPVQTFAESVQINDNGQVLARRTLQAEGNLLTPPFSPVVVPLSYLEKWNANNLASPPVQTVMASGSSLGSFFTNITNPDYAEAEPTPLDVFSPYRLIYPESSINNQGHVVFTAQRDDGTILHTGPHSTGARFLGTAISTGVRPQPMIADTGAFVLSNATPGQNQAGRVIGVFPNYQFGTLQQIANPTIGFTSVGSYPAISDDGEVIVFAGTHAQLGTGIYASIRDSNGRYLDPFKVIGVTVANDGRVDLGESWIEVPNAQGFGNGKYDTGEIDTGGGFLSAVSFHLRPGVTAIANRPGTYKILFRGRDAAGVDGLYDVRFSVAELLTVGGVVPRKVIHIGDNLTGVPGTVQDLRLHDSVNDNGQIVFWASMALSGGGSAEVIVAGDERSDADGDGLIDDWETAGIDYNGDGQLEVNLAARGADPYRKDLFVEVDAMRGRGPLPAFTVPTGIPASLLTGTALDGVVEAFYRAPVANPTPPGPTSAAQGINLHLAIDELTLQDAPWGSIDVTGWPAEFDTLKAAHFGTPAERSAANWAHVRAAKSLIFRYGVFAHSFLATINGAVTNGVSGIAELGDHPSGATGGNDFIVTLAGWGANATARAHAGTFMHELGHTLGLQHGGDESENQYKPNYRSVMNYAWQTPFDGASSHPLVNDYRAAWRLDYSIGNLNALNENQLNEAAGLGGDPGTAVPVNLPAFDAGTAPLKLVAMSGEADFNQNSPLKDTAPYQMDINGDSKFRTLTDHNDWSAIKYEFRAAPGFADGTHASAEPNPLTLDLFQQIEIALQNYVDPGPTADFNQDIRIDGADFLAWQRGFGITDGAVRAQGDADADGAVAADDLGVWQDQFGQGSGGRTPEAPMPATLYALRSIDAVYAAGDLTSLFYGEREPDYRPLRRLRFRG